MIGVASHGRRSGGFSVTFWKKSALPLRTSVISCEDLKIAGIADAPRCDSDEHELRKVTTQTVTVKHLFAKRNTPLVYPRSILWVRP
jgi:hypothetical protein